MRFTRIGFSIAFLVILVPGAADAAEIQWRQSFEQAAEEANQQKKPMLVKVTADWCGYCRKMQKSFNDENVSRHLNACFIPVMVDADAESQLVQAIGVEALPTTIILSPDGQVIDRITGFRTPEELDRHLGKVCNHEAPTRTASASVTKTSGRNEERQPAFRGVCLVTLLDDMILTEGSAGFGSQYNGQTLVFASAEHKKRFDESPGKYWPVDGGHCVVSGTGSSKQVSGDPMYTAIYRGRIWFFSDAKTRQTFAAQPKQYVSLLKK